MITYGTTDIGAVRHSNQDTQCIIALDGAALLIVCDGMGGVNGGDIASSMATEHIAAYVQQMYEESMDIAQIRELLVAAFSQANMSVYDKGNHTPEYYGMGTTTVVALVRESIAVIANIGDSRAYLIDGLEISQITKDHSMVQELLDGGNLSEEEARSHPKRNIITRALGIRPRCEADCYEVPLEEGKCILLCSDGFSNMLDEKEIALEIASGDEADSFGQRIERLITLANERGGLDNITVAAVLI